MKIGTWKLDKRVINQTERALLVGAHEVFAIWTAPKLAGGADEMLVDGCIVPRQKPGVSASGVWVHIEGEELQRIQLQNFADGRRSVIQLHSHPGADVRMSLLDREWEVVRHIGALSIIVPHYGRTGLALHAGANIYERDEDDWRLWSSQEAQDRLVIA